MSSIIDKHRRLEKLTGQRIILVGDSNLSFSINSAKIHDSTGRDVVNMGLHASMGLKFILNEVKSRIREGDIVIISTSWFMQMNTNPELLEHVSFYFPKALEYSDTDLSEKIHHYLFRKRSYLKSNIRDLVIMAIRGKKEKSKPLEISDNAKPYRRNAVNEWGDAVAHLSLPKKDSLYYDPKLRYRYYEGIKVLNSFHDFSKGRKVKVYFMWPCYSERVFIRNREVIERHVSDMRKDLTIPIIGTPNDFVFEDTLFFDCAYHLHVQGREERTDKVIEYLRLLIENPE